MTPKETLEKCQSALKEGGFYTGTVDGIDGPRTQAAWKTMLQALSKRDDDEVGGEGVDRTDWNNFKEVNVERLRSILPASAKQLADDFVQAGRMYGLHPLFLVAISKHETANWTSNVFRTKNNAMGISDSRGAIDTGSHEASINKMARGLSNPAGYYKNCRTLGDVGAVYAPIGAGNDPGGRNGYWPKSVAKYMAEFEVALA